MGNIGEKTFKEELLDFYKENYYFEIERNNKYLNKISFIVVILTITLNIGLYYYGSFQHVSYTSSQLWFYAFYTMAICSWGFSLWKIARTFLTTKEMKSSYIDTSESFKKYVSDGEEYNNLVEDSLKYNVREDFFETLSEHYSKSATVNRKNNEYRATSILTALKASLWSMIFIILSAPFFFYFTRNISKVTNVNIMNPMEVRGMSTDKEKGQTRPEKPSSSTTTGQQQQTQIKRPTRPQPQLIADAEKKKSGSLSTTGKGRVTEVVEKIDKFFKKK